jgi:hypothetical protein
MKGRKRKNRKNAIRINGEDGGKGGNDGREEMIVWRTRVRERIVPAGSAQRKRGPSLDPTLKTSGPSATKLDARRSQRMTRSGEVDVQGIYWDGDIGEDLQASDAHIAPEPSRRRVSDGRVIHNYRLA